MSEPVFVLKTSVGVNVTATIDSERFFLRYRLDPAPPYSQTKCRRLSREYTNWRTAILEQIAQTEEDFVFPSACFDIGPDFYRPPPGGKHER